MLSADSAPRLGPAHLPRSRYDHGYTPRAARAHAATHLRVPRAPDPSRRGSQGRAAGRPRCASRSRARSSRRRRAAAAPRPRSAPSVTRVAIDAGVARASQSRPQWLHSSVRQPRARARRSAVALRTPYGGRYSCGERPVWAAMTSWAVAMSSRTCLGVRRSRLRWRWQCRPTPWPASAISRASAGLRSTCSPTRKNVARTRSRRGSRAPPACPARAGRRRRSARSRARWTCDPRSPAARAAPATRRPVPGAGSPPSPRRRARPRCGSRECDDRGRTWSIWCWESGRRWGRRPSTA